MCVCVYMYVCVLADCSLYSDNMYLMTETAFKYKYNKTIRTKELSILIMQYQKSNMTNQ